MDIEENSIDSIEIDENVDNSSALFLECEDEPLTPVQKTWHSKRLKDFQDQMKKLENLAAKGATITAKSDGSVLFRNTETQSTTAPIISQPPLATKGNTNYRLLMDPRAGRILGMTAFFRPFWGHFCTFSD